MKTPVFTISAIALATSAFPTLADVSEEQFETIEVRTVRQRLEQDGRLKDVIQKTEVLDAKQIENKQALNLSQAIMGEPGVRVSNECSMCGVKRIMLNGMKGEHTTILIDGVPTHTLISGFYAVDAISTTGVEAIEVARGAGASLIAPEAIGGTVNVVSKEAYENSAIIDFAKGSHDYTAFRAAATGVSDDGLTGISLMAQYDKQDQEDNDGNGVSEAPLQENRSLAAVISTDISDKHNLRVRYANISSEVFGGPMLGQLADSIGQVLASYDGVEAEQLFVGDNVNNRFIGNPWETTEWIKTNRDEAYVKWLSEWSSQWSSELAVSHSSHTQDSFYEGIDYVADNKMTYLRAKADYYMNDNHFVTFGVDTRVEDLRSNSQALDGLAEYVSDSFDYRTQGLFVQDIWTPTSDLEIAFAVRVDKVEADFVDPQKPGVEIDETIVSPRLDAKYTHNDLFTSRFSAGRGYRAPLSFFETDHGILDAELGYEIDVDELEKSLSATYALSFDNDIFSWTLSLAHSQVDNLAGLDETEAGVPILTQLDEQAEVSTLDWNGGYQVNDNLVVNFTAEKFIYNQAFRESYAIAPIEERSSFEVNYTLGAWEWNTNGIWFGSRDLSEYGYEGFNIAGDPSSQKTLHAEAHWILNTRFSVDVNDNVQLYFGAQNLLDYIQIDQGDSPLFFDADGGYDVAYIWGPLHGREYYAGIKVSL